MPHADVSEGKAEKKPRKKMESERKRAASQANLAKAREARAKKKEDKLAAENENQSILDELVSMQKAKKKAAKEKSADSALSKPEPTPVFGKEKPSKKQHVPLSESEESDCDESEKSDESESGESSSEDELVLTYSKKTAAKKAAAIKSTPKAPKKSSILSEVEALKAEIAALKKEKKSSKAAPVNVFIGGEKKKMSAMEVKDMWGEM